jgi:hypothetical protein
MSPIKAQGGLGDQASGPGAMPAVQWPHSHNGGENRYESATDRLRQFIAVPWP